LESCYYIYVLEVHIPLNVLIVYQFLMGVGETIHREREYWRRGGEYWERGGEYWRRGGEYWERGGGEGGEGKFGLRGNLHNWNKMC
jgi:hypothetical protein